MEQNKLPKNIRQIGEKEDWIRVYIEDYVHTYIQRLRGLQEGGISGGVLLGKKQRINGIMHLFIRGAVVAEDPFWREPDQTPGQMRAESSVYFPELEICGFFISSRQNRSSEVDLVRIFETHFSSEYQILFNVRDQEEEVFSYSGHGLIRLAGYYIYYEKNEEMQSYIIRQESLRVLERQNGADMQGEPVAEEMNSQSPGRNERTGKTGKRIFKTAGTARAETGGSGRNETGGTGQAPGDVRNRSIKAEAGQTVPAKERRAAAGRKPASGKKIQKGDIIVRIVSIAGIFILAFLLFSDQIKFSRISDTDQNSSGILSSILNESSAVPAGADPVYIETDADGENMDGNENTVGNGNADINGNGTADVNETTGANGAAIGNEAAGANGTAGGDETTGANGAVGANGAAGVSGTVSGAETAGGSQEESDASGKAAGANAYVFPMKYIVKKGDSLYAICEKYYGDTEMVDTVCLENDISDPSKLKYGTILTLPAR